MTINTSIYLTNIFFVNSKSTLFGDSIIDGYIEDVVMMILRDNRMGKGEYYVFKLFSRM